jgi:hypothetical protein
LRHHAQQDLNHTVVFNLIVTAFLPLLARAPNQLQLDLTAICTEIVSSAPSSMSPLQITQLLNEARANWPQPSHEYPSLQLGPFKQLFLQRLSTSPL